MSHHNPPTQQINTRTSYDTNFRFRLWAVIIDDIALMGEGYRQYFSQVISELSSARNAGWIILNPNGTALNINALTSDDLYGFLGKANGSPSGPKRHISSAKLRILDAYIQYKFPNIYRSLSNIGSVHDSAMPSIKFLHGWNSNAELADLSSLLKQLVGVHLCMTDEERAEPNSKYYDAVKYSHDLVGLSVHSVERMPYCIFHEFTMPLERSFVNDRHKVFKFIDWKTIDEHRIRNPKMRIYSGFAIPVKFNLDWESVDFMVFFRDRITKYPLTRNINLKIHRPSPVWERVLAKRKQQEDGLGLRSTATRSDTNLSATLKADEIYLSYNDDGRRCEKFYDMYNREVWEDDALFTSTLYNRIHELHTTLGLEI